jgi:hypothetical protein
LGASPVAALASADWVTAATALDTSSSRFPPKVNTGAVGAAPPVEGWEAAGAAAAAAPNAIAGGPPFAKPPKMLATGGVVLGAFCCRGAALPGAGKGLAPKGATLAAAAAAGTGAGCCAAGALALDPAAAGG